ncbi:MAG TPA: hypothetical protein PLP01_12905, partial [Phycisphaerae bacterium]|nr:hypothetical protein [Phycisphaerae bacterium]
LGVVKPDDPKADNQEPKPVLLSDIIAAGWKSVKAAPEPSKESNEERLYRQEQESTPWVGKRLIMKGRITSAGSDPRNPDDYGIHVVYEGSRQVDIDASPYRKNRVPAERVGVGLRGLDRSVLGLEHGTPAKLDIVIRSVRFTGQYDRKTLHVTIIAESGSWE